MFLRERSGVGSGSSSVTFTLMLPSLSVFEMCFDYKRRRRRVIAVNVNEHSAEHRTVKFTRKCKSCVSCRFNIGRESGF